ncbi:MAG: FRG domain-containing protein [Salinivirgaceae bacterium]|nr:MAG: FRG domain-containing protein [Salinivirgaceae bacterium]
MIIEKKINSFFDFHKIIEEHNKNWENWYYRGESDPSHLLIPKAGRPHFVVQKIKDIDLFNTWCRHAIAYLEKPIEDQWDLLAIAQHHGLATRLLDWTSNPMIAAFFAVTLADNSQPRKTQSIIYAHYSDKPFIDKSRFPNPFQCEKGIQRVSPKSITPRIMRQSGMFTIHNPPHYELDKNLPHGDVLMKMLIEPDYQKKFTIELSHYGINKLSLFPDLDGLSRHVNWTYLNLTTVKKDTI